MPCGTISTARRGTNDDVGVLREKFATPWYILGRKVVYIE
jgi:hypothetical protein